MKKANLPEDQEHLAKKIKKERMPGAWKGKVVIADDFDELPADFMEYFN
jgi:hypothetical protein